MFWILVETVTHSGIRPSVEEWQTYQRLIRSQNILDFFLLLVSLVFFTEQKRENGTKQKRKGYTSNTNHHISSRKKPFFKAPGFHVPQKPGQAVRILSSWLFDQIQLIPTQRDQSQKTKGVHSETTNNLTKGKHVSEFLIQF